jgi:hypothetical protein
MISNGWKELIISKCFDCKWLEMISTDLKWLEMISTDSNWFQMVVN